MNKYKKYIEDNENIQRANYFLVGDIKKAEQIFNKQKLRKNKKSYIDLRNVLYELKIKKEKRLQEIQTLDINYITLNEAKYLGKENEWWKAYIHASRLFLAFMPSNPKNGNIEYFDDLMIIEEFTDDNIMPYDIYLIIETYRNYSYEEINEIIVRYKNKKAHK